MSRAPGPSLRLFEGHGIELEYMIVDSETLSVRPLADVLMEQVGGGRDLEVELGEVAWSNELALHVIEMKTNGPVASLSGVSATFQEHVRRMDALLAPMGARLLPTGMHPWMDPARELRLWPHENDLVYRTFDAIFDCRGHGWANLQSMHVNLPFADDAEFGRLHAALRLLLPILPALSASTPLVDGAPSGLLDTRLSVYRTNAARVPSVSGQVIPERVYTRHDYEHTLLQGIYDDLAPLDPQGVLHHEWVNARGCIARFDRMALEVRVLDTQECPAADLAIAAALTAVARALVQERWTSRDEQQDWDEQALLPILLDTIAHADRSVIRDAAFLRQFGCGDRGPLTATELWQSLLESALPATPGHAEFEPALGVLLTRGCLGRRIVEATGPTPSRERLREVYGVLADCLHHGRPFLPEAC